MQLRDSGFCFILQATTSASFGSWTEKGPQIINQFDEKHFGSEGCVDIKHLSLKWMRWWKARMPINQSKMPTTSTLSFSSI